MSEALQILATAVAVFVAGDLLFMVAAYLLLRFDGDLSSQARVWRSMLREIAWTLVTQPLLVPAVVFWPWWWHTPKSSAPPRAPILLVHGYGQNRGDFYLMGMRLRRQTGAAVYGINYWVFGPIPTVAQRVREAVDRIKRDRGCDGVDVVCHSMGGVATRYLLQVEGYRGIRSLTTLGSPHFGTKRARLAPGRSGRDMVPGSAFNLKLQASEPRTDVPINTVWSHADEIISPAPSAVLEFANHVHEVEDQGHLTLLFSMDVHRAVAGWLDEIATPWSATERETPMVAEAEVAVLETVPAD